MDMKKSTVSSTFKNNDLNLEATELRLGLPGRDEPSSISSAKSNNKRSSSEIINSGSSDNIKCEQEQPPPSKAQVVGWPPVRNYHKNVLQLKKGKQSSSSEASGLFVKVSMDGAPYLRKIDLKGYKSYPDLLKGLENMFKCTFGAYSEREGYNGSDFAPTYQDKDGDWMLVGDVPFDMFLTSCRRLRIIKASEARGLGSL